MFVDVAKIKVEAGRGGNGAVSFRTEIYVDRGGPDGGDGGKGGDIFFMGDEGLNTLIDFRFQPELKAKAGQPGTKRDRRGRTGEGLTVRVPIGTVVKDSNGNIIADIITTDPVLIARGGDGGYGNAHFKSSRRQAPRVAEVGEPGESYELMLELKLLADVGLVGFPNAGKSTFLSVVSNARPEIADYPFTTLKPNLGVADIDSSSLLIADIPGLIEGASEGKGLGDAFLRHIERTSVLLHLIDAYQDDIELAYKTIRNELESYGSELIKRPEIVAITKVEGIDKEMMDDLISRLRKVVPSDVEIFAISSQARINTQILLRSLAKRVNTIKAADKENNVTEESDVPTITLAQKDQEKAWEVFVTDECYIVKGHRIEKFARRTDFSNPHSINRLRDIMRKMSISYALERKGAKPDSIIRIGRSIDFTLIEQ